MINRFSGRRALLRGTSRVALLASGVVVAAAGGGGGSGAAPAPASFVATVRAHGAAAAQPVVAGWIGLPDGWLGASQRLVGTVDGVDVPVQQDLEHHHSSGSVQAVRVSFRLPGTLPADVTKTVTFRAVAGAPDRTPLVTPAAMAAAHPFRLRAAGNDLGGAAYETSIADIVQNFPQDSWGANPLGGWEVLVSGPVEVVVHGWRYRRDASSGAIHKWVRDELWVSAQADGAYEVYGLSAQGNWDGPVGGATAGGAVQTKVACALELYDGPTRIGAWGGPNDPRARTVAASALNASTNVVALGTEFFSFQAVTFSPGTGGALPSGIASGALYWLREASGGFTLHPRRCDVEGAANQVALGSGGGGSVVATPVVATFYGSGVLCAGIDGMPVRVGGAARPVITVGWDEAFLARHARLFPRYDQIMARYAGSQVVPGAAQVPPYDYYPNQEPFGPWLNMTGDNPGDDRVGYVTHSSLTWLLNPHDPDYRRHVMAKAAGWVDQPIHWCDPGSGRTLVLDEGPANDGAAYPGLGACRPAAKQNGYDRAGWLTMSGGSPNWDDYSGYRDGYSSASMEPSHMPAPWIIPAHLTGHPLWAEVGRRQANAAHMYSGDRNNQGAYRNVLGPGNQPRGGGWLLRAWEYASLFTGDAQPEGPYFRHALDQTDAWLGGLVDAGWSGIPIGMLPPYDWGNSDVVQQYQVDLWLLAVAMAARRGNRPGMLKYLRAAGNYVVTLCNDASSTGGSSSVVTDGYHLYPRDGSGALRYTTIRGMIAAEPNYSNRVPPYPATGFGPGSPWDAGPGNKGFPWGTTNYATVHRALLAVLSDAGIVALNGDGADAALLQLDARFDGSVGGGIAFSGTTASGISGAGPQWYPEWAIVRASA